MLDFYQIKEREGAKKGVLEVYPDFQVRRSKDLMVRAKNFYAIWDKEVGLWSQDEYDVQRLVDAELKEHEVYTPGLFEVSRKYLGNFSTSTWLQFRTYIGHLTDNSHQLDENLTFSNSDIKKEDYVSKKLPYAIGEGDISAYDELMTVLYDPEERAKLEWAVGAIISGDSKSIQKFLVLYGSAGSGKSTWINIVQWLTEGYWSSFDARELTGNNNSFSMESFKNNPLVAIDHDTDLSKITDNSKLNSIVSHEPMEINEKNKPKYMVRPISFLIVASNEPVKFTNAKSGLVRRIIDVNPSGRLIPARKYQALMTQIQFELGAIAAHCLEVYRSMGKDYYSGYRPVEMMLQTDVFFNYIEAHYDVFTEQDGATLKQAFDLYKLFCEYSLIEYRMPLHKFRDELKNYFSHFEERAEINGVRVRSWYSGFKADRFKTQLNEEEPRVFSLVMDETESLLDIRYADMPAQYPKANGSPDKLWTNAERLDNKGKTYIPPDEWVVSTTLKDLDTSKEHFTKVPENEIVIDFDLRDADGNKSAERNLEAASAWPPTYAEFSKSEAGIHLHYIYDGDVTDLSAVYEDGIEVKVFTGDASLRRKLSKCNNVPLAKINSGLPLKEKKKMTTEGVKSERALRDLIERNLRKEIHAGTKSSVDFIQKILEEAYASDLVYDVTDLRPKILAFANNSTNQALASIKAVNRMQFASEKQESVKQESTERPEAVFDVEVYPNLFVVCWKKADGIWDKNAVVKMINPEPHEIEELLAYLRLIGYNCRRYDNHILYARSLGFNNMELYKLSQKLINGSPNAYFGAAWDLSYTDIYDYTSLKQSLKQYQIDLDIPHVELDIPWDQPVPPELVEKVVDYCANDVLSTDAVHAARKQDFIARQILSDLSGLSVNATTQQHASRIVFNGERRPQEQFVYTNLKDMFPGYEYDRGKSTYLGESTGEGGYVYAEPGMYSNVAVLDVASMHPTSIEALDLFGPFTKNFSALKSARLAIKHGDYDSARTMLDGKLAKHLLNEDDSEALSYALKIVINIVYGLTAAKFDNSFRDPKNIDNIVAKRGALFMINLKNAVQAKGFQVVHIKTDSIKIPNATPAIIEFVMDYGNDYGYTFEHEATYEKFCLVNDAVYIARTYDGRKPAHWEAVGAQFKQPYVFKYLFSKERIMFKDKCEPKSVVGSHMYLEFPDPNENKAAALAESQYRFIGKTGLFVPVKAENGGGRLVKKVGDDFHAVTGTSGHQWLEAEMVKTLGKEKDIDMSYFTKLVDKAKDAISKYGDFEQFVATDTEMAEAA